MAHYLPYCSKYNPIEHKSFCHISRGWCGVILYTIHIVKEIAEQVKTKNGLSVIVKVYDKIYELGRKVSKLCLSRSCLTTCSDTSTSFSFIK